MPNTIERHLESAALDLAARGYHVFPLRPQAKTPATTHGFKDATRDERQILYWWDKTPDANIAVACGPSGVVVFDIDAKAGADPREILREYDRAGAPVIGTGIAPPRSERHPHSLEGRRGAQAYYRGHLPSTPSLKIPGCEIKGAGGYVVAPPSIHPSGVEYVGQLPPVAELPPVPGWLRELVQTEPRQRSSQPRKDNSDPLLAVPADTYIPALTGRAPGRDGKIACPFHNDGTPSLHLYSGAGGWWCYGCQRGGSIIDFGALRYGIEPRGPGFLEIRRRLAEDLLAVFTEDA